MSVERGSESAGKSMFGKISKITVFITFILGCVAFAPLAYIESREQKIDVASAIVATYQTAQKVCRGRSMSHGEIRRQTEEFSRIFGEDDAKLFSDFYSNCLSDHQNGWSWSSPHIKAASIIFVQNISRDFMLSLSRNAHTLFSENTAKSLDGMQDMLGELAEPAYEKHAHFPSYILAFLLAQIIAIAIILALRIFRVVRSRRLA